MRVRNIRALLYWLTKDFTLLLTLFQLYYDLEAGDTQYLK